MGNKLKPKYKRGQKFEIEIAEVHTHYDDKNKPYSVYRIKGFNSLVFDDKGLDKLNEVKTIKEEEVDWTKVDVDTPILVKSKESDEWEIRYFAGYDYNLNMVSAWNTGRTSLSKQSPYDYSDWKYAKLLI